MISVIVMSMSITGCGIEDGKMQKLEDLDYSVVETTALPEELAAAIEEKKEAQFKMTYETERELYIVRGYGEQETGGYSICVRELYLTQNAIYFSTELIGPEKTQQISKSPSYPYIVVKLSYRGENVIFD